MPVKNPSEERKIRRAQLHNIDLSDSIFRRSSTSTTTTTNSSGTPTVRAVITTNVTTSGTLASGSADGVTLTTGDKVLLTAQTAGADNLIYTYSSTGPWSQDLAATYATGMAVYVQEGEDYKRSTWKLETIGTISPGTTALTWGLDVGTVPDGNITTAKLADDAVTSAKIDEDAVNETHIASGAIGSGLSGGSGTPIALSPDNATIEVDANGDAAMVGKGVVKVPCRAATTASLASYTVSGNTLTASANGALAAQDGVTLVVNDRLLVKNETAGNAPYNGAYFVGQVGGAGSPWVLTRTADANSSAATMPGILVPVSEGTTNGDKMYHLTTNGPITLNTTALTFSEFGSGSNTAGEVVVRCVVTRNYSGAGQVPNGIPTTAQADGVTLTGGEKVLVIQENNQKLVGTYIVSAGTWARSSDTITAGMQVQVMFGGSFYGGAIFHCRNTTTPVIGTDNIMFGVSKGLPLDSSVTAATIVPGAVTSAAILNSSLDLQHLSGSGSAPTIAAGPAAGTGPTVSITGTDLGGLITVTTGTATVLDDVLCTITFNTVFAAAPRAIVICQGNNDAAGRISQVYVDPGDITTSVFKIRVGLIGPLTASTTYKYHYIIIG